MIKMIKCALCEDELRKDQAYIDAGWSDYKFKGKLKTLCRDCQKIIALGVVESY